VKRELEADGGDTDLPALSVVEGLSYELSWADHDARVVQVETESCGDSIPPCSGGWRRLSSRVSAASDAADISTRSFSVNLTTSGCRFAVLPNVWKRLFKVCLVRHAQAVNTLSLHIPAYSGGISRLLEPESSL